MAQKKSPRRNELRTLVSFAKHPAATMTLRTYLGTGDEKPWGRAGWYADDYAKDWRRGFIKAGRMTKIAQGPLSKWRVENGWVVAREVFSIAKVSWDEDYAFDERRDYRHAEYAVLLLRSVETVHGRTIQKHTVAGNYDFNGYDTTCSLAGAYRGRGLGRTFLLAAQMLARKAEPASDLTRAGYANRASAHRLVVEQAIKAGRPVRKSVLADYPDLVRRYAKRHLTKRTKRTLNKR